MFCWRAPLGHHSSASLLYFKCTWTTCCIKLGMLLHKVFCPIVLHVVFAITQAKLHQIFHLPKSAFACQTPCTAIKDLYLWTTSKKTNRNDIYKYIRVFYRILPLVFCFEICFCGLKTNKERSEQFLSQNTFF